MKGLLSAAALVGLFALSACVEQVVTAPDAQGNADPDFVSGTRLADIRCTANVTSQSVACEQAITPSAAAAEPERGTRANRDVKVLGRPYIELAFSNVSVNSSGGAHTLTMDARVQNLMNESIGTPDGVMLDPNGIMIFLHEGPTLTGTGGTGTVTVDNASGFATMTASNQAYFTFNEKLATNQVSSAKTLQFGFPATVTEFTMKFYVQAEVQPLLVINEVMVNPAGAVSTEQPLEWFELYNAGTLAVDLEGYYIADSAASGRRPYHRIASSVVVVSGGYAVLGGSTNTTLNGGVPVDYSYGTALNQLANSLDAVKISRLFGANDTLTIDRTQYASAAVSAQEGISRELKNPALDNSNMDGSNWGTASVTSVYGTGGRGTPKAQNSAYTP
jgi:hypothetical protein